MMKMIKQYRYTDKELKELLKSIVIIIDTAEEVYEHISSWFDSKKIPYVRQKLNFADYSFYLPANPELGVMRDLYFTDEVSIERKAHLEELSSNFVGTERIRIENEFRRHQGRMTLLIEGAEYQDIINHNYKTEYKPASFLGTLHSFSDRYDVPFVFMKDNKYSAQYIYYTMYYFLRNYLLNR